MFIGEFNIDDFPFPANTKVRVTILGLAYCKLNDAASEINFLRHLPNHKLTMSIFKRDFDTRILLGPVETTDFSLEGPFDIEVADPELTSFEADVQEARNELGMLVFFGKYHDGQVLTKKKGPTINRPPTPVTIHNCAFYTLQLADLPYALYESSTPTSKLIYRDSGEIGYVLSGNITSKNPTSDAMLKTRGNPAVELRLRGVDANGATLAYDIVLDNHCMGEDCGKRSDFDHYYDILEDPTNDKKTIKIMAIKPPDFVEGSGNQIAACNPAVTDPPGV